MVKKYCRVRKSFWDSIDVWDQNIAQLARTRAKVNMRWNSEKIASKSNEEDNDKEEKEKNGEGSIKELEEIKMNYFLFLDY